MTEICAEVAGKCLASAGFSATSMSVANPLVFEASVHAAFWTEPFLAVLAGTIGVCNIKLYTYVQKMKIVKILK